MKKKYLIIFNLFLTNMLCGQKNYFAPSDLRIMNENDTATYILQDTYRVQLVYSKHLKVSEIYFSGVEEFNKTIKLYKGRKTIFFRDQNGIQVGPQLSLNKKNRILTIAAFRNGQMHCYQYIYNERKNILRSIHLYTDGHWQQCEIVYDDQGKVFFDPCNFKDELPMCR